MLIKNTLYIYLKLDLLNVYFKEEFIMKKFKFLAIFLFSAVIGLAGISKSSASSSDVIKSPDSKNAMYIPNGNGFTKYMSTSGLSQDILNDIKSILNNIKGQTIYVRDYSMYQRLKSLGASDITNSSDEIVTTAKAKYGYNIYMVRF